MILRKAARRGAAALWLALAAAMPAPAQELTPGQMRGFGFDLLAAGQARQALAVADALLARDADDATALILRARALRDLGEDAAARDAARTAWARAETPSDRYGAALTRAQALASSGRRTEAQFWLRRAADVAPSPQARAVALRDFRYVRGRNPLRLSLSLGVAPSANVNNGSRHAEVEGFGIQGTLSPDAQALSGWAAEFGLGARLRLAEAEDRSTWLRFSANRREVRLSSSARAAIEQYRRDQAALGNTVNPRTDFDYGAVELGLAHNRAFGKGAVNLGLTLGHNWYGGEDLSDYLRLDLAGERGLGPRRALYGGLGLERQWRNGAGQNADLVSVQGGLVQATGAGDRLRFGLGGRNVSSISPYVRHRAVSAQLGWEKAAPVAGMRIDAGLSAERRWYDASLMAPQGRDDLRLEARVSVTLEKIDYMGFAPRIDLHASRARSTVKLHDGQDIGITLGFRSLF